MRKIVYICPLCRDMTVVVDHVEDEDKPLPDLITCDGTADHACHREEAHQARSSFPPNIVATHETYLGDDGNIAIRRKP